MLIATTWINKIKCLKWYLDYLSNPVIKSKKKMSKSEFFNTNNQTTYIN